MGNANLTIQSRGSPGEEIRGDFVFTVGHDEIIDKVDIYIKKYTYTRVEIEEKYEISRERYYRRGEYYIETVTRHNNIGINEKEVIAHKEIFNNKYDNLDAYKIKTVTNLLCQKYNTYKLDFAITIPLSADQTVKGKIFGIFSMDYKVYAVAHRRSSCLINRRAKQDIIIYNHDNDLDIPINFTLSVKDSNVLTLDIPNRLFQIGTVYECMLNLLDTENISLPCTLEIYISTKIVCYDKDMTTTRKQKKDTKLLKHVLNRSDKNVSFRLPLIIPKNVTASSGCQYGWVKNKLTMVLCEGKNKHKITRSIIIIN